MARFFLTSRISDHIAETPEGYLLCSSVPIARTGSLDYLPEEVGLVAADGLSSVTVYRLAEDLFAPAVMASFEGKPFTNGHPDEEDGDVGPENWSRLARGHVQNVRRGDGSESDLLLADILVTDAAAIQAIRQDGIREISIGYDAQYTQIAAGVGRQTDIVGNHVALVDEGRCGPRVAIKDAAMKLKKGLLAAIFGNPAIRKTIDADPKAKKALDEAIAEEVKDEDPQQDPPKDPAPATDEDPMAEMLILLRTILQKLDVNGAPATADEEGDPVSATTDEEGDPQPAADEEPVPAPADPKTQDRRSADAATVARAVLIAPHLAVRTGDSALAVKRAALRSAKSPTVRATVDALLNGRSPESVDRLTLDAAFAAAAEVARVSTNRATADALLSPQTPRTQAGDTPASLNAQFAEYRKNLGASK